MPSPTTSCARNVTCLATSCVRSARRRARLRRNPRKLATSRRRIGFVFLQPAHSPPAASHPVSKRRDDPAPRTTQLLSAICAAATHGTDSHRTDQRTDGRTRVRKGAHLCAVRTRSAGARLPLPIGSRAHGARNPVVHAMRSGARAFAHPTNTPPSHVRDWRRSKFLCAVSISCLCSNAQRPNASTGARSEWPSFVSS